MENKRGIGITAFGVIFILIGIILSLLVILIILYFLPELNYAKNMIGEHGKLSDALPRILALLIIAITFFSIGRGIIRQRNWARISMFILLAITSPVVIDLLMIGAIIGPYLLGYVSVFGGLLYLLFITICFIYFTRRRIKEQFK
jgi:hypothetical protein